MFSFQTFTIVHNVKTGLPTHAGLYLSLFNVQRGQLIVTMTSIFFKFYFR
jgi:hypothetical protein